MPNDNKRVPYFEAKQSFNVQDSAFFVTKGRRNSNMQNLILLFEKSFGNSFVQSLTKKKASPENVYISILRYTCTR